MRNKQLITIGAVAVAALVAVGFIIRYRTAQSQQTFVARVNGQEITSADYTTYQTRVARIAANNSDPNFKPNLQLQIDHLLEVQEATRQGIACSVDEGTGYLRSMDDLALSSGGIDVLVLTAIENDDAPADLLKTPAALRTPSDEQVVQAYEHDPKILHAMQDACSISRLFNGAQTPAPPPGGQAIPDNGGRPDAGATLVARLRREATIELGSFPGADETATPSP